MQRRQWLTWVAVLVWTTTATAASRSVPVFLKTPTGTLSGALLLPDRRPPYPVALIIAGSGPTDRDGNSRLIRGRNNSLKMLARALVFRGIASLRYDKRGVGQSRGALGHESDLRFDHFVQDAAAWVRRLKRDKRFGRVVVIGHSQGSLVGMLAARRTGAYAFVSLAGAGRPAWKVLRDQIRSKASPLSMIIIETILDQLRRGKTTDLARQYPGLNVLFRPSVQPFLIGWFRYDPARELARLRIPILVVGGTTDIQVPVSEAKLLARANPRARLKIIPGMNHVLKPVPSNPRRQFLSYGDPSLPLAPGLVEAVIRFILR
ncbi:MAG: lysophospholipase [Proteobacteria bacterium]|nr:lysophospholipase [Pseudomonadota bacterium]MBU1741170.1 lysophospholipase [Pseudomonadota bacterium]